MEKNKFIKQILTIFVIILEFILFNYSFYNLVTKNYINNYGKGMQEKSINIESYLPFKDDSLIVHESSAIKIVDNIPQIDGATALYPIYSAYVEALYPKESVKYDGKDFLKDSKIQKTGTTVAYQKVIDGETLNFYYLEYQLNQSNISERECYWSENNSSFLLYRFIEGDEINFYRINDDSYLEYVNNTKCITCNNNKGYYKIENNDFICSDKPPADNYALDILGREWRECNRRCKKCYFQSRSDDYHHCLLCNDYFYPYQTDYDNYIYKKEEGFSCYTKAEVYLKYDNYFLNSQNQFEKCDDSCNECETKNECITCSQNYYYIHGYENGTCFHYPLSKYGLVYIDNSMYFMPCFHLCKYCNKITQSFLYQQCSACDEINYTLDIYSYNKSLCIPKDKSNSTNSYFIKKKTKWYINITNNDFEGLIV